MQIKTIKGSFELHFRMTEPEIEIFNGYKELNCGWKISEDGKRVEWNGEVQFAPVPWLKHMIRNLLQPWGNKLHGRVEVVSEDPNDGGVIVAKGTDVSFYHNFYGGISERHRIDG